MAASDTLFDSRGFSKSSYSMKT